MTHPNFRYFRKSGIGPLGPLLPCTAMAAFTIKYPCSCMTQFMYQSATQTIGTRQDFFTQLHDTGSYPKSRNNI